MLGLCGRTGEHKLTVTTELDRVQTGVMSEQIFVT